MRNICLNVEKIFSPRFPHQKWVEMINQIFIKRSKVSKVWGSMEKSMENVGMNCKSEKVS